MSMPQEVTEAVQLPELPARKPPAQNALRAESIPLASVEVTQGDETLADPAWMVRLQSWPARTRAKLTVPTRSSLLHTQSPTIAGYHQRHREAAQMWQAALIRGPRRAWGFLHTLFAMLLDALKWATESPIRAFLIAAFLAACWYWL